MTSANGDYNLLFGILLDPLANGRSIKRDEWETFDGFSLFQKVASELERGAPVR